MTEQQQADQATIKPIDDLAPWVDALAHAEDQLAHWQEARDTIKARITDRLGDATQGAINGRTVVRWTWVQSNRLDVARLRAERPEWAEAYTVPQTTRRFSLVRSRS